MSLEAIIEHILSEAESQGQKILLAAGEEKAKIIRDATLEAERLTRQMVEREREFSIAQKQKEIVNARLWAKKSLLQCKQGIISEAFLRLKSAAQMGACKKIQVSAEKTREVNAEINFYLDKLRLEQESEVAKILFT